MFITKNQALFHLRYKENLVKHQKVSEYYDHDFSREKQTQPVVIPVCKNYRHSELFWSAFSRIRTEYDLNIKFGLSPHSE